jgi:hypothetical protein
LQTLPFEVAKVHVDAIWHRRSHQRGSHLWLRQAVVRAAQKSFSV